MAKYKVEKENYLKSLSAEELAGIKKERETKLRKKKLRKKKVVSQLLANITLVFKRREFTNASLSGQIQSVPCFFNFTQNGSFFR